MMKVARLLLGLLLTPVCVAATRAVVHLVFGLQPGSHALFPPAALALAGGIAIWLLVYYTLPPPVRTYVLAHELTHALWAAMMGARVKGMKVSKSGGSVTLSDSNVLITLAPYFFPLYTVIVIAAYLVLSLFIDGTPYYLWWMGLVGLTWGFHLTFTIGTLLQHQSDIAEYGRVFSYAVIVLLNVLGVGLWIVAVSSAGLEDFAVSLQSEIVACFVWLWDLGAQTARHVQ